MAARRPVVSTDVGGIRELVLDGKTGMLVPPNRPELLVEKLVALVDSEVLRRSMGEAGRHRVESSFTTEMMLRHYERFYSDLLLVNPRIESGSSGN